MEMDSLLRAAGSLAVSALFSDRNFATSVSNVVEPERISARAYMALSASDTDATEAERNSEHLFVFADASAGFEEMLA